MLQAGGRPLIGRQPLVAFGVPETIALAAVVYRVLTA